MCKEVIITEMNKKKIFPKKILPIKEEKKIDILPPIKEDNECDEKINRKEIIKMLLEGLEKNEKLLLLMKLYEEIIYNKK